MLFYQRNPKVSCHKKKKKPRKKRKKKKRGKELK